MPFRYSISEKECRERARFGIGGALLALQSSWSLSKKKHISITLPVRLSPIFVLHQIWVLIFCFRSHTLDLPPQCGHFFDCDLRCYRRQTPGHIHQFICLFLAGFDHGCFRTALQTSFMLPCNPFKVRSSLGLSDNKSKVVKRHPSSLKRCASESMAADIRCNRKRAHSSLRTLSPLLFYHYYCTPTRRWSSLLFFSFLYHWPLATSSACTTTMTLAPCSASRPLMMLLLLGLVLEAPFPPDVWPR